MTPDSELQTALPRSRSSLPRPVATISVASIVLAVGISLAACGGSDRTNLAPEGEPATSSQVPAATTPTATTTTDSGPQGLAVFDCSGSGTQTGASLMFVDPATGDQSNMAQLPRYLDGRGGQLSIRFPGSVEYCSDTNGGDLQYAVRSIFNDAYSKAAVTIGLPEQGTDHIGYVTLASGEITDLTEPRVTSGFSEDKLLETNAAFGPDNHLLFLRSGSTDLLAQQVDQTDVAPWNQANVGVVADPGDDGRGAPLPAITVGPTGTATPSAISIVYDTNPWVPSRFGPRSIAGKLNDCPTADCVQVGDPTSIENDDTTVVSVRSTSSASDCRPLAWIAKNRVVCSSDSSADADQPSQLLTIGTLSSAGPRLAIEPLTVVAPRELSNAVLSPDEKTVAFVSSDEDGKTVYTAPLAAPAPVEPTRVSQLDDNMILIGWR